MAIKVNIKMVAAAILDFIIVINLSTLWVRGLIISLVDTVKLSQTIQVGITCLLCYIFTVYQI